MFFNITKKKKYFSCRGCKNVVRCGSQGRGGNVPNIFSPQWCCSDKNVHKFQLEIKISNWCKLRLCTCESVSEGKVCGVTGKRWQVKPHGTQTEVHTVNIQAWETDFGSSLGELQRWKFLFRIYQRLIVQRCNRRLRLDLRSDKCNFHYAVTLYYES